MPRFSANLSLMFTERPFLERFAAATAAGFTAVEFQFPYDHHTPALTEVMLSSGVEVVLFNLPAGDLAAGDLGIACDPARKAEFQDGVGRAIEYALALDTPRLNGLAGRLPPGVDPIQARETLIDNLRFAATVLAREGIQLLLEPINTRDVPGYFVSRSVDALALMDAVNHDNLRLQYDIYHAQVMEGDLVRSLSAHLGRIGHIQVADNPGRHEPGSGEINFGFLFHHLDALGYGGWVGCEYRPAGLTEAGLGWMEEWR